MISENAKTQPRLLLCLDLLEPAAAGEDPRAFQRCVANSRRLVAHAREAGWEVVHCLSGDLTARAMDAASVRSDDGIGAEIYSRVAVRLAAPFANLSRTDEFVGRRPALQLVSAR